MAGQHLGLDLRGRRGTFGGLSQGYGSRSRERSALSKQGMSLHMEWTTRTDPATCCGLSEEAMDSSYWLIHGHYFDLEAAKFVKPIGIEHFFDAFSLEKKRPLKIDLNSHRSGPRLNHQPNERRLLK